MGQCLSINRHDDVGRLIGGNCCGRRCGDVCWLCNDGGPRAAATNQHAGQQCQRYNDGVKFQGINPVLMAGGLVGRQDNLQ